MRKRVLFVREDSEEIGRGESLWPNPNTEWTQFLWHPECKERWFLSSVILLQSWYIFSQLYLSVSQWLLFHSSYFLVFPFQEKYVSQQQDNVEFFFHFVIHFFTCLCFIFLFYIPSRMMLSVLHFVMGDFLHEKVVTQRELNIKAGFPLRTLHFVQKKRIMRLFLHCCVTSDGQIGFGQGQIYRWL